MKLTLKGQLLTVVLVGLLTVLLGVTVSFASGREPLPEPPQWRPGATSW